MLAVLHLADFPLQAVLRTVPGSGPAALLSTAEGPAQLVACTAAARAAGVVPGQTPAQALARCAELRLWAPQPDAEREAAAALLAAAWSVSPHVELTAPGLCTLQVGGLEETAREGTLARACQRLRDLGLHATGGIARTPLLALYAARETTGVLTVREGREFLHRLPLDVAAPPPELAEILASWGLATLGDLTALPKAAILQRLGPEGLALWERAAGETTRPLQLLAPPPAFTAAMTCTFELETLEPLLFLLRRFVDRLVLELETAGLAAAEVTLALLLADETDATRTLRLAEPSADPDTIFRTLHTYLETVRTNAAVVGVRLDFAPARRAARQHGLFERALRDPHRFAETLSRVAALVGPERVGTPRALDTHRPDALVLDPPAAEIPPSPIASFHPPAGLALRRYRPPQPVTVLTSGTPSRPLHVRAAQLHHEVRAAAGPWRSAGDWWQADRAWRREEWDVELDGLYRLVRTPEGWFLDGEYD